MGMKQATWIAICGTVFHLFLSFINLLGLLGSRYQFLKYPILNLLFLIFPITLLIFFVTLYSKQD